MKKIFAKLFGGSGISIAEKLSNIIGNHVFSKEEQARFEKEMEEVFIKAEIDLEKEISLRHQNDMVSDSWLSKNIRPLTLAFLTATLFIYIILDSSIQGFKIDDNWIDLLSSLLLLVYGGYFGARTVEKVIRHRK